MSDNLNGNDKLFESCNITKEVRKDSGRDTVSFREDITITKTEIKEERYDFDMSVRNMEFENANVKYISSSDINFAKEIDLGLIKSMQESFNSDFRKDPVGDTMSFNEEISALKTVVKKESYDFEMSVDDVEFVNVKEEYISLPVNNFEKENLDVLTSTEQSLNENLVLDTGNHGIRKVDPINNKSKCELCDSNSEQKTHMEDTLKCTHLKGNNIKPRPFKCPYKDCKCTPGQENSCNCNMCPYAATRKTKLNRHVLAKHSAEPKRFKCINCEYVTHWKENLVAHSRTHTDDRRFKCTYKDCKCTPGQEESCTCNTCGYASKSNGNLKKHMLAKHNAEPKKYKCKDCKYDTHRRVNLLLHTRIHTGEKPFKCTFKNCKCEPGQEKSCECSMCPYAASRKCKLNRHILAKHSAVPKKFKCIKCEYTTHRKEHLLVHSRTHINQKL